MCVQVDQSVRANSRELVESPRDDTRSGVLVLAWVFVGAYLELPLPIGGGEVPGFLLVLTAPLLFYGLRNAFYTADLILWLCVVVMAMASVLLVPNIGDIYSRFRGFLQFGFSVTLGLLVFKLVVGLGVNRSRRVFFWLIAGIVILTILERNTLLSVVSDNFRYLAYRGGYTVYDGDLRDINLVGFIRPKVFTSEPSLVNVGFLVASVCYLAVSDKMRPKLIVVGASLVQWHFSGSPIAGLPIVIVVLLVVSQIKSAFAHSLTAVASVVIAGALLLAVGIELPGGVNRFDSDRLTFEYSGADKSNVQSEKLRLVFPYVSAIDSIKASPAFGLGVGGKRSLEIYSSFATEYEVASGNNAFATVPMYFGILGTGILLVASSWFLRRYGIRAVESVMLALSLSVLLQTIGGMETPRCGVYVALLAGCWVLRSNHRVG